MNGDATLARFLGYRDVRTVIDIGSGPGLHAEAMRASGVTVTTVSLREPADVLCDYMETDLGPVDGIWACHVLEHQTSPGAFLRKCFADLRDDGVLGVTVPPLKHYIVGGHVTLWNAGLLLYQLILAGFDCSRARVGTYGYNVSVIVQKVRADLPELRMDGGDIKTLARFFPCPVVEGFDGRLKDIRW